MVLDPVLAIAGITRNLNHHLAGPQVKISCSVQLNQVRRILPNLTTRTTYETGWVHTTGGMLHGDWYNARSQRYVFEAWAKLRRAFRHRRYRTSIKLRRGFYTAFRSANRRMPTWSPQRRRTHCPEDAQYDIDEPMWLDENWHTMFAP